MDQLEVWGSILARATQLRGLGWVSGPIPETSSVQVCDGCSSWEQGMVRQLEWEDQGRRTNQGSEE